MRRHEPVLGPRRVACARGSFSAIGHLGLCRWLKLRSSPSLSEHPSWAISDTARLHREGEPVERDRGLRGVLWATHRRVERDAQLELFAETLVYKLPSCDNAHPSEA